MSKQKDSIFKTFLVAFLTCAVCSVFVASAAVLLKPIQEKNQALFKNKNILVACGLVDKNQSLSATQCEELLKSVKIVKVDLSLGVEVADEAQEAELAKQTVKTAGTPYKVGIASRDRVGLVYIATNPETKETRVVLPVVGKGLWSVLKGFIALDAADMNTVKCLLFYEQGETAGLGGEIENPLWTAKWVGKKAFNGDLPAVKVVKGSGNGDFEVDGISGATLTGNGVTGTIDYWLAAYRPFLTKLAAENGGEN